MNVAILTQPLLANYGCILQNYALQEALRSLGHRPVTLDYLPVTEWKWYLKSLWRSSFHGAPRVPLRPVRPPRMEDFVQGHIATVPQRGHYRRTALSGIDALVVGSDQVWRPRFNRTTLPDMFFDFAGDFAGRRLSYAASFGTDRWEADAAMTERCAALLRRFDAVSVREPGGVPLCREVFGVEAELMPDPVFLLDADSYLTLCEGVPRAFEPYVAAYILDDTDSARARVEALASETGLTVRRCTAGADLTLSMAEWIALLRDAAVVVTDSFHGAALSRILGRRCEIVENPLRGRGRYAALPDPADIPALCSRGLSFLRSKL